MSVLNDFEKKVFLAFTEALNLDSSTISKDLIYNEFPGWDSVAHMMIIEELESSFDCMMEVEDVLELSSYDKACEIMKKYT
jgi:acyl carrier protein